MSSTSGNSWIDDELRNVAVPADLAARLQAISSRESANGESAKSVASGGHVSIARNQLNNGQMADAQLDQQMRSISVPTGLQDRLLAISNSDEDDLTEQLRNVTVPIYLRNRLAVIPSNVARKSRRSFNFGSRRWAVAAAVLVGATIGVASAVVAVRLTQSESGPAPIAQSNPPVVQSPPLVAQPANNPQGQGTIIDPTAQPPIESMKLAATGDDNSAAPLNWQNADEVERTDDLLLGPLLPVTSVAANQPVHRYDPDQIFGASTIPSSSSAGALPILRSMSDPATQGIVPPRVPGYDLRFQFRHGVHPFVAPAAHKSLETCTIPVATESDSFDAVRLLAQDGKLLAANRIRTEDFLAAMNYRFQPPTTDQALAIRAAAGPSPWNKNGANLLQVALQAAVIPRDGAAHLIVLLDASQSMQWEGRWNGAIHGLSRLVEHMSPADRISIVLVSNQANTVVANADRKAAAPLIAELHRRVPDGQDNFTAALNRAKDLLSNNVGKQKISTRMVLLTDGLSTQDEESSQLLNSDIQRLAASETSLAVVDVRRDKTTDPQLRQIATSGRLVPLSPAEIAAQKSGVGDVKQADTSGRIRWALFEALAGKSQAVAADITFKVTFRTGAVAKYRLLGHEATSLVNSPNNSSQSILHSGEATTGLFELALHGNKEESVALIEASWKDMRTGKHQNAHQELSRKQFAPSLSEAPFSLQLAALAAQTAEILRESYFAPPSSHSLTDVARTAQRLSGRLKQRKSIVQLSKLIEQVQRAYTVSR